VIFLQARPNGDMPQMVGVFPTKFLSTLNGGNIVMRTDQNGVPNERLGSILSIYLTEQASKKFDKFQESRCIIFQSAYKSFYSLCSVHMIFSCRKQMMKTPLKRIKVHLSHTINLANNKVLPPFRCSMLCQQTI
jgi:hypothetical protein